MERLSHSVLLDLTICSLKKQLMLVSTSSSTFSLVIVIIIVRHASAQLIARAVTARRHAVAVVVVGVDNVSRRAHLLHLTHLRHDVFEARSGSLCQSRLSRTEPSASWRRQGHAELVETRPRRRSVFRSGAPRRGTRGSICFAPADAERTACWLTGRQGERRGTWVK